MVQRPTKGCSGCGETYDAEAFFTSTGSLRYAYLKRPMCNGCEQAARDSRKCENRWRGKVNDTRTRHARKFKITSRDLRDIYGWNIDQMAHEAEHAYENGCPYCRKQFKTMGHGLGDITLDIVNPEAEPFYVVNGKWCCKTCNTEKRRTPPHLWAIKLQMWERWERRQAELLVRPMLTKPMPMPATWLPGLDGFNAQWSLKK